MKVMEWIDVKDRLPEHTTYVLIHFIYDGESYVDKGAYYPDGKWIDCDYDYVNVTHWMPLPKPPNK